jgi:cell shape-determining protein MreC
MAEGAVLETAGLGGVFPAGIPVGTVLTEAASRSGWSHSYLVEPAVQPGAVSAVTAWERPEMEAVRPVTPAQGMPPDSSGSAPGGGEEGPS